MEEFVEPLHSNDSKMIYMPQLINFNHTQSMYASAVVGRGGVLVYKISDLRSLSCANILFVSSNYYLAMHGLDKKDDSLYHLAICGFDERDGNLSP